MNDHLAVNSAAAAKATAARGRKGRSGRKTSVLLRRGESGPIAAARVAIVNSELQRALRLIRRMVDATGSKDLSIRLRMLIDEFIQAENRALVHGERKKSYAKAA